MLVRIPRLRTRKAVVVRVALPFLLFFPLNLIFFKPVKWNNSSKTVRNKKAPRTLGSPSCLINQYMSLLREFCHLVDNKTTSALNFTALFYCLLEPEESPWTQSRHLKILTLYFHFLDFYMSVEHLSEVFACAAFQYFQPEGSLHHKPNNWNASSPSIRKDLYDIIKKDMEIRPLFFSKDFMFH